MNNSQSISEFSNQLSSSAISDVLYSPVNPYKVLLKTSKNAEKLKKNGNRAKYTVNYDRQTSSPSSLSSSTHLVGPDPSPQGYINDWYLNSQPGFAISAGTNRGDNTDTIMNINFQEVNLNHIGNAPQLPTITKTRYNMQQISEGMGSKYRKKNYKTSKYHSFKANSNYSTNQWVDLAVPGPILSDTGLSKRQRLAATIGAIRSEVKNSETSEARAAERETKRMLNDAMNSNRTKDKRLIASNDANIELKTRVMELEAEMEKTVQEMTRSKAELRGAKDKCSRLTEALAASEREPSPNISLVINSTDRNMVGPISSPKNHRSANLLDQGSKEKSSNKTPQFSSYSHAQTKMKHALALFSKENVDLNKKLKKSLKDNRKKLVVIQKLESDANDLRNTIQKLHQNIVHLQDASKNDFSISNMHKSAEKMSKQGFTSTRSHDLNELTKKSKHRFKKPSQDGNNVTTIRAQQHKEDSLVMDNSIGRKMSIAASPLRRRNSVRNIIGGSKLIRVSNIVATEQNDNNLSTAEILDQNSSKSNRRNIKLIEKGMWDSMRNKNDHNTTLKVARKLKEFADITIHIGYNLHIEETEQRVRQQLQEALDCERVHIWHFNSRSRQLWCRKKNHQLVSQSIDAGLLGYAFHTNEPINSSDPYADARFDPKFDEHFPGDPTNNIMCQVIKEPQGHPLGVIEVSNKRKMKSFSALDEVALHLVSKQIGIQLSNGNMMDMIKSESDTLEALIQTPRLLMEAACPTPQDYSEIAFAQQIEQTAKSSLGAHSARVFLRSMDPMDILKESNWSKNHPALLLGGNQIVKSLSSSSSSNYEHGNNDDIPHTLWRVRKSMDSEDLSNISVKSVFTLQSGGIVGSVAQSCAWERIKNPHSDDRFNRDIDVDTGMNNTILYAVPFLDLYGTLIGVLEVAFQHESTSFTSKHSTTEEVGHTSIFLQEEYEIQSIMAFTDQVATVATYLRQMNLARSQSVVDDKRVMEAIWKEKIAKEKEISVNERVIREELTMTLSDGDIICMARTVHRCKNIQLKYEDDGYSFSSHTSNMIADAEAIITRTKATYHTIQNVDNEEIGPFYPQINNEIDDLTMLKSQMQKEYDSAVKIQSIQRGRLTRKRLSRPPPPPSKRRVSPLDDIIDNETRAAVKIQSIQRGRLTRKRLSRPPPPPSKRRVSPLDDTIDNETRAAVKIQSIQRGRLTRKRLSRPPPPPSKRRVSPLDDTIDNETRAAVKIQSIQRGRLTRKRLSRPPPTPSERRVSPLDDTIDNKTRAAVKIQSIQRGRLTRKRLSRPPPLPSKRRVSPLDDTIDNETRAAVKIQSIQRGRLTRKRLSRPPPPPSKRRVSPLDDTIDNETRAAVKIQSIQRGRLTRKRLSRPPSPPSERHVSPPDDTIDNETRAAVKIQSIQRGRVARKRISRMRNRPAIPLHTSKSRPNTAGSRPKTAGSRPPSGKPPSSRSSSRPGTSTTWEEVVDEESGEKHYKHRVTGEIVPGDVPPPMDGTLNDISPWVEVWDDESNAVYYYNNDTEETSWEYPILNVNTTPSSSSINDHGHVDGTNKALDLEISDWSEYVDEEGNVYYYNSVTEETSWEIPETYRAPNAAVGENVTEVESTTLVVKNGDDEAK